MNNKGFTLIEVIVSLAILSIIAIGIVPAFATSYRIMNDAKNITVDLFQMQQEVEGSIVEIQKDLAEDIATANATINAFGKSIMLSKSEIFYANNKRVHVYLSEMLAKSAVMKAPKAENVKINVSNDPDDLNANHDSYLTGTHDTVEGDAEVYTHIYRWYVSKEEAASPEFPKDFNLISGINSVFLSNLSNYANRHIVFTVIPIDIYGLRGREVASQFIHVSGADWKDGEMAWVDINNNGKFDEGTDIKIETDYLKNGFDTTVPYYDEDLGAISLQGGSLYIPTNIGELIIDNEEVLDWNVCKNINIATNIEVHNDTDISFLTREGNITLYQYKNATGNDVAPILKTNGNLFLVTEGRGNITLQRHSKLISNNIEIASNGQLNIKEADILAAGDIIIDTTRVLGIQNNRNIVISDSNIRPIDSSFLGKIEIKSRHNLDVSNTKISSNGEEAIHLMAGQQIVTKSATIGELDTEGIYFRGDIIIKSEGSQIQGDDVKFRNRNNSKIHIEAAREVLLAGADITADGGFGEIKIKFTRTLNIKNARLEMGYNDNIWIFTSEASNNNIDAENTVLVCLDNTAIVEGSFNLINGPAVGEIIEPSMDDL